MRTVLFASLRAYVHRYVAAAIAIVVAVAFVVVAGVLTAAAQRGLMDTEGAPYRGADYVVRARSDGSARAPACCPGTLDIAAAIELVERLGERASGLGRVALPARTGAGAPLAAGVVAVGPVATAPALRWQKLVAGRFPARPGEAAVHVWDAQAWKIGLGERIQLGEGAGATVLEVVGLVESPSTWTQASIYVTWPQYLRWSGQPSFHVGSVAVRGEVGPLAQDMTAVPAKQYVMSGLAKLDHGVDAFGWLSLLLAGVALFVAALVVANTFSILFAQRRRELALLRCIGATRGQVARWVRQEAMAIGVLASSIGTLVGAGLGYGLVVSINAFAPGTPMSVPAWPLLWLVVGFLVGLILTLTVSWVPIRGAARVSPWAALRPDTGLGVDTPAGRWRIVFAVLCLAVGLVLLGMAVMLAERALMLAGGMSAFIGVLLFGPLYVPRLIRLAAIPIGLIGRLAAGHAASDPRRIATTAAALLAGITLMTAVLTGLDTWRAALDEHRDTRLPIDVAITSLGTPITSSLLGQVRRTPGVEQAMAVEGTLARISGWNAPIPIVAAPDATRVARDGGAFAKVGPGTIRLDHEAFRSAHTELSLPPDRQVTVRAGDRQVELKATFLGGWGQAAVVAPETLAQLTAAPAPRVIWIRASAGADRLRLVDDLRELARGAGAQISDRLQARAAGDRQLDILTWSVLGLLGMSVAIALIGIANTLGLSVVERAREHALLRALGLTRGQLRRMLATEALLLSVIAALLGTLIGVGFAWVAYEAVVKRVLDQATLRIPWCPLGAVVLITALAGSLASVLPARRAARISPAAGLAGD